jgi:hypothetical protein
MEFRYSTAAQRALSETWQKLIETGAGDAWLEFYSGKMPASTDEKAPAERLLARLYIKPHTMQVLPDNAVRSGDATWGRIVGCNGRAAVDFDVTTKDGGGVLEFNTLTFRKNGTVTVAGRLDFFGPYRRDADSQAAQAAAQPLAAAVMRPIRSGWN